MIVVKSLKPILTRNKLFLYSKLRLPAFLTIEGYYKKVIAYLRFYLQKQQSLRKEHT
jgi:hypothetical protein